MNLANCSSHDRACFLALTIAFTSIRRSWHTCRLCPQSDDKKEQARERFQKVKAAYEVLKDPELKRQYDRGQAVAL